MLMSGWSRGTSLAVACAAALAVALPLAGCGSSTSVPADLTLESAPPNGGPAAGQETPALGQELVFRAKVTRDGEPFGYLYGTKLLVAMPGEYGAPEDGAIFQNTLNFVLPDGEITVTGTQVYPLEGLGSQEVKPATRAISGGTGVYAGVTGVLTSTQTTGKARKQVFDFSGN